MKKLAFLLLALPLTIPAMGQATKPAQPPAQAPAAPDDTVVEQIVARVNNAIITRADLRRSRESMIQEVRQQNPPNADEIIAQREKDLLKDLINQQLLVQKGADLGISGDTELVKRLDEIRKSINANSMEELEKAAEAQGVSFEDFKQNLRNQIITQQVIGREVGGHIQVSNAEVKDYYEKHKAEMEQPEQVRLSEIIVPVEKPKGPDGKDDPNAEPTPEAVAASQAKANDLLKQIRGGAKFEDLAKKFSSGPSADQGGDLGYFKRGSLSKDLEDKTFSMKAGDVTDVVRTKQGFVILKVSDHVQAGIPPMERMENQIQEALYYQKLQPALDEYFKKLREDAYIDVKPGYVDTGTVAGQTKPIFTDATAKKEAKKEKKKKKLLIF